MSKAKPIDRVEYTKRRFSDDGRTSYIMPPVPVQRIEAVYDEELGAVVDCGTGTYEGPAARTFTEEEMGRLTRHGMGTCPVCGAKIIHESGCVRCTCGWSRC